MAANGTRYRAAMEILQNFAGQISSNTSSGASGYSSLETLFVRRAFGMWQAISRGIVRAGRADGIIGLYDFGMQYAPNTSNGFGNGSRNSLNGSRTGAGIGTGNACTWRMPVSVVVVRSGAA
jgi:hypothetical protein